MIIVVVVVVVVVVVMIIVAPETGRPASRSGIAPRGAGGAPGRAGYAIAVAAPSGHLPAAWQDLPSMR